jgi:hypothetical protein
MNNLTSLAAKVGEGDYSALGTVIDILISEAGGLSY